MPTTKDAGRFQYGGFRRIPQHILWLDQAEEKKGPIHVATSVIVLVAFLPMWILILIGYLEVCERVFAVDTMNEVRFAGFVSMVGLALTGFITVICIKGLFGLSSRICHRWAKRQWTELTGEIWTTRRIEPAMEGIVARIKKELARKEQPGEDPHADFYLAVEAVLLLHGRTRHTSFGDYVREMAR